MYTYIYINVCIYAYIYKCHCLGYAESCSRISTSHVTNTHKRVMSQSHMSERVMSQIHMMESCHTYMKEPCHTHSHVDQISARAPFMYIYIHTHCVPRRRVPRRCYIYIIVRLEGTQISARAPSRHAQMNES